MEDYIKIKGWPPADHARKAYENGYYIEALQTLHGWIECKLRELLLMQRTLLDADHDTWALSWDISNEFSLNNAAKALFILGAVSEDEYKRILQFNRVRNNLVHKLFYDPYDESWRGVRKDEFEKAYQAGLTLCEEVEFKSNQVLEKKNPSNK